MPKIVTPRKQETQLWTTKGVRPVFDRNGQEVRREDAFSAVVYRTADTPESESPNEPRPVEFRITNEKGKILLQEQADHLGQAVDFIHLFMEYRNCIPVD